MKHSLRSLALVVIGLALLVAGCGDDDTAAEFDADGITSITSCDEVPRAMKGVVGLLMGELGETEVGETGAESSNLVVFMDAALGTDPLETLAAAATGRDGVMRARVVTREEAIAEFNEMFADEPEMLEVVAESPEMIPASLRLFVDFPYLEVEAGRYRGESGITGVETWDDTLILRTADQVLSPLEHAVALRNLLVVIGDLGCPSLEVSSNGAAFDLTPPGPAASVVLEALRIGFTP